VLNGSQFPVQTVGIVLLCLCVVYFAVLWFLKPGEKESDSGSGTVTTGGASSPVIGSVGGDSYQVTGAPGGVAIGRAGNVQVGARAFEVTPEFLVELEAGIIHRASDRLIEVEAIGPARSLSLARQIADYLRSRGFNVAPEVLHKGTRFLSQEDMHLGETPVGVTNLGVGNAGPILITVDAGVPAA
jgi:hypothetical protein